MHKAFYTALVLDVQAGVPDEVKEDARRLWMDFGYGNDTSYHYWNEETDAPEYPALAQFLKDNGVTDCRINYWW